MSKFSKEFLEDCRKRAKVALEDFVNRRREVKGLSGAYIEFLFVPKWFQNGNTKMICSSVVNTLLSFKVKEIELANKPENKDFKTPEYDLITMKETGIESIDGVIEYLLENEVDESTSFSLRIDIKFFQQQNGDIGWIVTSAWNKEVEFDLENSPFNLVYTSDFVVTDTGSGIICGRDRYSLFEDSNTSHKKSLPASMAKEPTPLIPAKEETCLCQADDNTHTRTSWWQNNIPKFTYADSVFTIDFGFSNTTIKYIGTPHDTVVAVIYDVRKYLKANVSKMVTNIAGKLYLFDNEERYELRHLSNESVPESDGLYIVTLPSNRAVDTLLELKESVTGLSIETSNSRINFDLFVQRSLKVKLPIYYGTVSTVDLQKLIKSGLLTSLDRTGQFISTERKAIPYFMTCAVDLNDRASLFSIWVPVKDYAEAVDIYYAFQKLDAVLGKERF